MKYLITLMLLIGIFGCTHNSVEPKNINDVEQVCGWKFGDAKKVGFRTGIFEDFSSYAEFSIGEYVVHAQFLYASEEQIKNDVAAIKLSIYQKKFFEDNSSRFAYVLRETNVIPLKNNDDRFFVEFPDRSTVLYISYYVNEKETKKVLGIVPISKVCKSKEN